MYIKNKRGPRTVPCGTPDITGQLMIVIQPQLLPVFYEWEFRYSVVQALEKFSTQTSVWKPFFSCILNKFR